MNLVRLQIDKALPTPAYLQLKSKLINAIEGGDLPAGTALPSERELADRVGLSRMTVRRAFEELVSDKFVEQKQGSGTYVLGQRLEQTVDRVLGFTDEVKNLGHKPGSRLLSAETVCAELHVADALELSPNSHILKITRLRTADGEPLAIQTSHLVTGLLELSLERLKNLGSLYRTIEAQYGLSPQGARQTVSARMPTKSETGLLGMANNVPVLAQERLTFDAVGKPFEYVESAYRGDRYRMALDLSAP